MATFPSKNALLFALLPLICCATSQTPKHEGANAGPPIAEKIPRVFEEHGQKREDPYYWLRERENPKVVAYLEAENRYTEAALQPTEPLRKQLFEEMKSRVKEDDVSVPYKYGNYEYGYREVAGKEYAIHFRRPLKTPDQEEILLDENKLAEGSKYFDLTEYHPSPDAKLLAYTIDLVGDEHYALLIKDLQTGQDLPDKIPNTSGNFVWSGDGKSIYYTTLDETNRTDKIFRHDLGTPADRDPEIYHEKDNAYYVSLSKTRSERFIVMNIASQVTNELRLFDVQNPKAGFALLDPRKQNVEYTVDHTGDRLLILTNDDGATNFKVMETSLAKPERKHWKELIPHRPEVLVNELLAFRDHLVLREREGGLSQFQIRELKTRATHRIAFEEENYSIFPENNFELDTTTLRFSYTSLITPRSVFDYDMNKKTRVVRKEEEVPGYDKTSYVTRRIFATGKDGTKVPLTLAHKKTTPLDGTAPGFMLGYGAYGSSGQASFRNPWVSLMDRGFVVAIAHIRGGSELGRTWYETGKLKLKTNTFEDFIACGETLITEKFVAKHKLTIFGRSAGGLLMGAVVNMRPDLFRAVVADVPFVDVINTMLDPSIPLTVIEWEEWGNPNRPEDYQWMRAYSPYDNLEKKEYPAMLIGAGLNDRRVCYWEPAKYVARLRTLKTDDHLLLLRTNMTSGHAGATGRYAELDEDALYFAFLIHALEKSAH